jgi:hypothetical protein
VSGSSGQSLEGSAGFSLLNRGHVTIRLFGSGLVRQDRKLSEKCVPGCAADGPVLSLEG